LLFRYLVSGIKHNMSLFIELSELKKRRAKTFKHRTVVLTNGCFDVIHAGHIRTLRGARVLGDMLIVAINSDASIRRIKSREPLNSLEDRVYVLSEFKSIDYIISFDEDTPINIIQALKPNVLVKGGDYESDKIVGASEVKSYGGKVVVLDFYKDHSSSSIIRKLRRMSV